MKKKTIVKWLLVITLSAFPAYWLGSIAKCEILTLMHGDNVKNGYLDTGWFDDIQSFKIIDYSQTEATVYYVNTDRTVGFTVLFFKNQSDYFEFKSWDVVWSKSGSADGFIWPYIR